MIAGVRNNAVPAPAPASRAAARTSPRYPPDFFAGQPSLISAATMTSR
jgi:hypothetical protein